jgi:hypothetical protein
VQNKLAVLIALAKRRRGERRSIDQNMDIFPPDRRIVRPEAPSNAAEGGDRPTVDDRRAEKGNRASARDNDGEIASDASAFGIGRFGSRIHGASPRSNLLAIFTTRMRQGADMWRHHLQHDQPPKETRRSSANVERGLLALLTLLVVVSCTCAAIALIQVKSSKSEIAALQRELLPLKERIAQLDLAEKIRRQADQESAKDKSTSETSPRSGQAQAALNLTTEEIQLVKEYIKPAPSADTPANPIRVGDLVDGAMIPLPSPLTDKVPKLLGARFAIRDGTIIIVRKDSRQADAVLGPN